MIKKELSYFKKKLFKIVLTSFIFFIVSSCISFHEVENGINTLQCEDIIPKLEDDKQKNTNIDITTNTITKQNETDNELERLDTYTIHHEKDSSTYIINIISDSTYMYTIELFDEESNKLQCVFQDYAIANPYFEDVNLDGYMDIVVTIGGTLNEIHDLYIWDATSQRFTKVIFEGFDMLSYFEIYDGYIKAWAKTTSKSGVIQKLVWNGHILSLESEESYELNTEGNVIKDSTELMLSSIKSKDLNEFKSILCDEFYIIRYLSGGRGIRGKTIKFLYSKNEAPEDFMVDIDKEIPIDFTKMFKQNVIGKKDIEIIDSNFNIPDEVTIISEYVSQIQEIITKNISIAVEDETKIIKCSNGFLLINLKGILKDEVTEIVLGSIAIFLKVNDQYYVRCLISML